MQETSKADLQQLIELWQERFPKRAIGGQEAILGFRFQFIVALRDAVRAFLKVQASEPATFIERVSDVCQETTNGEILFTQVKRTLRTVNGALDELWSIHTLACDALPELVPRLRYRVLCSRSILKNVDAAIDRWQSAVAAEPAQIESFMRQVSWAADPNPFDELLALVANGLDADEPLPTVLSWIGQLTDPERGSRNIWSELQALRNKQERGVRSHFYLWSSEDCPPHTVERGHVLIAEQPKPYHLRRGYFSERLFYRSLAEKGMQWISSSPRERDHALRVPILWLRGRSGCGKSVALLHLLSLLREEGLGPILWLGSGVNLLPETVRCVPGIAGPNDQVIIALDDPYTPYAQGDAQSWRDALAELNLLQCRTTSRLPILVCCGPTDQANQLREDFPDDVNIYTLTVPHTLEDRQTLASWYERRTGTPVPDVGEGDVMVAQLFFEWRTGGPFSSFARRFRERLVEMDPTGSMRDTVYRIVAMNRLYAGYPQSALDSQLAPEQQDAFACLVREHHFSIDEDPERPGVWLTHPHLTDTLFEAWLPNDIRPNERRTVLKEAILDGFRYGETPRDQTSALWAFARLARSDKQFRSRLEADNPGVLLPDVYASWHRESGGSLSLSHLPAWLALRFAFPGLRFDPDPVGEALALLLSENKDDTGFRLTCHKLLEHWRRLTVGAQREVASRLSCLLTQTQQWREWPFIAMDAVWHIDDDKLRRLVGDWLLANHQEASLALSWLLLRRDLGPNREWLLNIAGRWIDQHIDDRDASPVLSSLLNRRDLGQRKVSVATVALNWVQRQLHNPQVERVLRRLLGVPMSRVATAKAVRLALDYLAHSQLQPSSSFLLGPILRARVINTAGDMRAGSNSLAEWAIRLGLTWLERNRDDPSAPYVADRLLRLPDISDPKWSKIASGSLVRLRNERWPQDADYTLISLARRRHLLSQQEKEAFSGLLRDWLGERRKSIAQLISRHRFSVAARYLTPALPLAAHLGDSALREEFEARARVFREKADELACKEFDKSVRSLFKAHAWPNQAAGRETLRSIGLIREESRHIGVLNRILKGLAATAAGEVAPSLPKQLAAALEAAEESLANGNFRLSGYLAAKMLPVAARVGEPYLTSVETLTQRFMSLSLPPTVRCGFMMECDRWIGQNAWANLKEACRSFERVGFDTPKTLDQLACTESSSVEARLTRSLNLVEELLGCVPVRAGLFLAPLLVLATKSGDKTLSERCQRAVREFLESAQVDEGIKARLADRVHRVTGAAVPDSLHAAIDSLGLQAPLLAQEAHAAVTMSNANLQRHLRQAEQLVERGFLRVGTLLAPLLSLAARSSDADLQAEALEVTARMLEHPRLTHEIRDGFAKACRSFPWPGPNVKDEVFEVLGIGAPRLEQLLVEPSPVVPVDVLRRSLNHAAEHLIAGQPGAAHHILQAALPLASWTGDEKILGRALELARQLLDHPKTSVRLRDHISKKWFELLKKGRWQSSDSGEKYLGKIGLEFTGDMPSASPAIEASPKEQEEERW